MYQNPMLSSIPKRNLEPFSFTVPDGHNDLSQSELWTEGTKTKRCGLAGKVAFMLIEIKSYTVNSVTECFELQFDVKLHVSHSTVH